MKDYKISDIFKFESRDISRHMMYEIKLGYKFKDAFNYITTKLPVQKLKSFKKLKWEEGKNYNWAVIKDKDIILIVRHYHTHFTMFFKNENKKEDYYSKYGCFTFHSNREKMNDINSDKYVDNNFIDLDILIESLLELLSEDHIHSLWNNYSFIRPDWVEVKNIWNGNSDDISSVDEFAFCLEELFGKYLELFAENDMLEKLKSFKVGDKLNEDRYEILSIKTEVKDDYYHSAGLNLKGTNGKDSESWCDVYCLTRFYLDSVFP